MRLIVKHSSFFKWLAYVALVLASYVFLQPAFEGFDENPHYSRILDASADVQSQFSGKRGFRTDVLAYPGPEAYASGQPPFDTAKTYDKYYAYSQDRLSSLKVYKIDAVANESPAKDNWQYQHPPLYYVLVGIASNLISMDSMLADIILWRLFSVILTVISLIFCYLGLHRLQYKLGIDERSITAAFALFALCFPMFYIEFARLGNDSLVFLCLSIAFYCSARAYKSLSPKGALLCMAAALMCGLWTKAIVLPLLPIFAIFSLHCLWHSQQGKHSFWVARDFFGLFLLPVGLGLGWYAFSYLAFNDLGLGSEARDLGHSTGLLQGLYVNFDGAKFVRGLVVPLVTFVYAGSWSLIRAPILVYTVLGLIQGALIFGYLLNLVRFPRSVIKWMPFGLFAFLYAGLAYHVLVSMALSGLGTSGGWYLYVLTPWLLMAICLAAEVVPVLVTKIAQWLGLALSAYLFASNALIYAGHIVKADDKAMKFVGLGLADLVPNLLLRLEYVAYPWVAFYLFVVAIVWALINLYRMR